MKVACDWTAVGHLPLDIPPRTISPCLPLLKRKNSPTLSLTLTLTVTLKWCNLQVYLPKVVISIAKYPTGELPEGKMSGYRWQ